MANGKVELFGAHTTRTIRPVWVLEELGVDYELYPIAPRSGETQTDEYTSLNPKQKIPFMRDGDVTVSESLAISRYLVAAYGNENLPQPATPAQFAKEDEWCCYALGELDETSLYIIRRHRDLGHIYGESEVVVASCFEYLARHLTVVESHLAGRDVVVGDHFSLADIMLHTCLSWAEVYGATLGAECKRYVDQIGERPAYQRAFANNYKPSQPAWDPATVDRANVNS